MRERASRAAPWVVAVVVFVALFETYSFRLGVDPRLMHDDFEYTHPSYSLAERGDYGSPLLGHGFNVDRRTYHFAVYYYAAVHAALIRVFGDAPESIPLGNVFHLALLAAAGCLFLGRRGAWLGAAAFVAALVLDERLYTAARQGRPEMTAGCGLVLGVVFLWVWLDERRGGIGPALAAGAAFTAGIFSHTAMVFFTAALGLAWAPRALRRARPVEIAAALLPFASIPALYAYFLVTDSWSNFSRQMAPMTGNVVVGELVALVRHGEWATLAVRVAAFLREHVAHPVVWAGALLCLALPIVAPGRSSAAARHFAAAWVVCLGAHLLFLKPYVLTYRSFYQPALYLALAFAAEVLAERAGRLLRSPFATPALRLVAAAALLAAATLTVVEMQRRLAPLRSPFPRLRSALEYALAASGARPGDRVLAPSPFVFHLRERFEPVAYPAIGQYFQDQWGPGFRAGLREVWGAATLSATPPQELCFATGLAYLQPRWVVAWNRDYGILAPFRDFLRHFPTLPGIQVSERERAELPWPYGGVVRVYRLDFSPEVSRLDRAPGEQALPCP